MLHNKRRVDRRGGAMQMSVNQLAAATGKDRRTIASRVQELPFKVGPKSAHLYDSAKALALVYLSDGDSKSLDGARIEQALENAALAKARREEIQKTRIPLPIVLAVLDAGMQAAAATLKAARGKTLAPAKINEILSKLRDAKLPLKW